MFTGLWSIDTVVYWIWNEHMDTVKNTNTRARAHTHFLFHSYQTLSSKTDWINDIHLIHERATRKSTEQNTQTTHTQFLCIQTKDLCKCAKVCVRFATMYLIGRLCCDNKHFVHNKSFIGSSNNVDIYPFYPRWKLKQNVFSIQILPFYTWQYSLGADVEKNIRRHILIVAKLCFVCFYWKINSTKSVSVKWKKWVSTFFESQKIK